MIDMGAVENASELARSPKLEVGWVCEVLRINNAVGTGHHRGILDGRRPWHLNLHAMRGRQGGAVGLKGAAEVLWFYGLRQLTHLAVRLRMCRKRSKLVRIGPESACHALTLQKVPVRRRMT